MASPIEGGRAPKGALLVFRPFKPARSMTLSASPSGAPPRRFVPAGPYFRGRTGGNYPHVIPAGFPAVHPDPSSH